MKRLGSKLFLEYFQGMKRLPAIKSQDIYATKSFPKWRLSWKVPFVLHAMHLKIFNNTASISFTFIYLRYKERHNFDSFRWVSICSLENRNLTQNWQCAAFIILFFNDEVLRILAILHLVEYDAGEFEVGVLRCSLLLAAKSVVTIVFRPPSSWL